MNTETEILDSCMDCGDGAKNITSQNDVWEKKAIEEYLLIYNGSGVGTLQRLLVEQVDESIEVRTSSKIHIEIERMRCDNVKKDERIREVRGVNEPKYPSYIQREWIQVFYYIFLNLCT